jgi:hypothetical protein
VADPKDDKGPEPFWPSKLDLGFVALIFIVAAVFIFGGWFWVKIVLGLVTASAVGLFVFIYYLADNLE